MELEEHTVEDLMERGCEVCGAPLTEFEIHEAREAGRPFLCSVHAAEDLPAAEEPFVAAPPDEGAPAS
jgi:hypothetical protein